MSDHTAASDVEVVENTSSGEAIKCVLETNKLLVSVGASVGASLRLNVATFVRQTYNVTSDFSSTVSFAQGRDVFAFHDANGNPLTGYTANAGTSLVNDRFGAATDGVPVPGVLALFMPGLAGPALARDRQR